MFLENKRGQLWFHVSYEMSSLPKRLWDLLIVLIAIVVGFHALADLDSPSRPPSLFFILPGKQCDRSSPPALSSMCHFFVSLHGFAKKFFNQSSTRQKIGFVTAGPGVVWCSLCSVTAPQKAQKGIFCGENSGFHGAGTCCTSLTILCSHVSAGFQRDGRQKLGQEGRVGCRGSCPSAQCPPLQQAVENSTEEWQQKGGPSRLCQLRISSAIK